MREKVACQGLARAQKRGLALFIARQKGGDGGEEPRQSLAEERDATKAKH